VITSKASVLVDNVLRRDPSGVYSRMDFLSRDRQRRAVEELAEPTAESQIRVALKAVETARQVASQSRSRAAAHVGHHLIGGGRAGLELDLGYRPKLKSRVRRAVRANATAVYLGAIAMTTAPMVLAAVAYASWYGASRAMLVAGRAAVPDSGERARDCRSCRSSPAASSIPSRCRGSSSLTAYRKNPGRSSSSRRCLTSIEGVASLLEHLEVLSIANRDPRIHFAILSDHADSPTRVAVDDEAILAVARSGVESLNERSAGDPGPKFFLFHRDRQWNERERVWMGWERKRGKLEEFNRLVRGATDTSFTTQVGPLDALAGTKVLHHARFGHAIAARCRARADRHHLAPLNRPVIDPKSKRVTDGYGILQPRVSVTMASAAGSLFARTYAGHTGVDPYTTAVSDVYQDLFGEGIFTGKGLYDIDAFMTALEGRVPENALLSHDLFEGIYARAGLVTDVEVVDDYPSNVLTHARRQHRWVRGDWQILWWLFPVGADTRRPRAQLPAAHLALEDPRQPAAQPRGALARRVLHRRMVAPARLADRVDDRRACDDVVPGHRARALALCRAPQGPGPQGLPTRLRGRSRHRPRAHRDSSHLPRPSGVGHA
jgi:cyclic beta-1,2-glucan synthetase